MKYSLVTFGLMLAATGCQIPVTNNLPPASMLMHPGPGVDGPGPGVMMIGDYNPGPLVGGPSSQIAFVGPDGMMVGWDVSAPGMFDSEPLVVPGRYNFPEGAIYRLKLTNIPGRPGVELYPTLELAPAMPRTIAYLTHNAIPAQFTEEDFDQVLSGNFVTKVIYLPDAEFQDLALAGVETLVSTRLDPGLDPIVEADRRGSILAILRMGNKDLEMPGSEQMVGGVAQVGYGAPCGIPGGMAGVEAYAGGGLPPNYMAGVTAPQWGMPMVGTPIGLPGPPHIPLGGPAGLQKHTITNHTHVKLPQPVPNLDIHVKQTPGMSYPKPASHAFIHEHVRTPHWPYGDCPPPSHVVYGQGGECVDGSCPVPSGGQVY